ncbi:Tar ligand binding domain-containing protein [Providencia vermicola]
MLSTVCKEIINDVCYCKKTKLPNFRFSFSGLKTTTLIWLLSGLLIVLLLSSCWLFFSYLKNYQITVDKLDNIYQEQSTLNKTWQSLLQARNTINRASSRHLLVINKMQTANTDVDSLVKQFHEKIEDTEQQWLEFASLSQNKNELIFNELDKSYIELRTALIELSSFLVQGKTYDFLNQPTQKFQDAFEQNLNYYHQNLNQSYHEISVASEQLYRKSIIGIITVIVILTLVTLLIRFILQYLFIRPLNQVIDGIEKVSQGILYHNFDHTGLAEIKLLKSHVSNMQKN